jgi:hypothetical protein
MDGRGFERIHRITNSIEACVRLVFPWRLTATVAGRRLLARRPQRERRLAGRGKEILGWMDGVSKGFIGSERNC